MLEILNNKAKKLPFLRSNQLIFALQSNIIKNKKVKPYVKWFEFAQKTRNENNQKKDFDPYMKDAIFMEMIRKLSHKSLDEEDLHFIQYYRLLEGQKDVWEQQYREEGEQIGLEKGEQIGLEKGEQIGLEKGAYKTALTTAQRMKKDGLSLTMIVKYTGLSEKEINNL